MTRPPALVRVLACLALLVLAPGLPAAARAGALACDLGANGTFRFLTEGLPTGSTNAEYIARLVTANADGPLSFSVDQLPPGMSLDPASGFITGRPTSTFNEDITFEATDGVATIQSTVNLKVNAAGGGGNAGATFSIDALPEGRVGELYSATLGLEDGVGPFVFGAVDLPPGVTLDGLTGQLTGVPTAPGTYFAGLSVYDAGEDNKVVTVLPIVVLPATSDFRFTTQFLNNGEVGTLYCDTWVVENAPGAVTFAGSGLPAGLLLDPATGVVSGTPTVAGTFVVLLSASDGGANTITTNLAIQIAPGPTSTLHWNFFGLPTAIVNVSYDRQPPILVAAEGADAITYSVIGLPTGMTYAAGSGELSGTPIEIGEYPLTFTAVDTSTSETLVLSLVFLVLPPNGGDASQIPVNFWVAKESVRTGEPERDAWRASAIYNADRRVANRFDPLTDTLRLELGARVLELPPGSLEGSDKTLAWRSPKGETPAAQVKLGPGNQTLSWATKNDTLTETVPGILTQTVTIGNRGYRLLLSFDERGVFHPALDFERAAFVVRSGKLTVKGPGDDGAKLALLLSDPNFAYEAQTSPLRIRLLEGANVLVDRDFMLLGGEAKLTTDSRTGSLVYAFKTLKDAATVDRIAKFSYQSGKGTLALALADMDLAGLPADEAHLGVELTIGTRTYYTAVTFFEGKQGRWSTTMPGR